MTHIFVSLEDFKVKVNEWIKTHFGHIEHTVVEDAKANLHGVFQEHHVQELDPQVAQDKAFENAAPEPISEEKIDPPTTNC